MAMAGCKGARTCASGRPWTAEPRRSAAQSPFLTLGELAGRSTRSVRGDLSNRHEERRKARRDKAAYSSPCAPTPEQLAEQSERPPGLLWTPYQPKLACAPSESRLLRPSDTAGGTARR